MTCIVGIKVGKNIYIGGDSIGVGGYNYSIRKDSKVFKKDNMIFGYTSSFRMGNLIQYKLQVPEHPIEMSSMEYLCTLFMDSLMECFEDASFTEVKDNVSSGGQFLLGYRDELYTIYADFQVEILYDKYTACGSGQEYALGALSAMESLGSETLKPSERIVRAITAAEKHCTTVKGPVNIVEL